MEQNTKTSFAKDELKGFIERIERVESEMDALKADRKEIYSEAKGVGFDPKIMRIIVRKRKKDKAEFDEEQAMEELYMKALDMVV